MNKFLKAYGNAKKIEMGDRDETGKGIKDGLEQSIYVREMEQLFNRHYPILNCHCEPRFIGAWQSQLGDVANPVGDCI
jgi:hypothetical protein